MGWNLTFRSQPELAVYDGKAVVPTLEPVATKWSSSLLGSLSRRRQDSRVYQRSGILAFEKSNVVQGGFGFWLEVNFN